MFFMNVDLWLFRVLCSGKFFFVLKCLIRFGNDLQILLFQKYKLWFIHSDCTCNHHITELLSLWMSTIIAPKIARGKGDHYPGACGFDLWSLVSHYCRIHRSRSLPAWPNPVNHHFNESPYTLAPPNHALLLCYVRLTTCPFTLFYGMLQDVVVDDESFFFHNNLYFHVYQNKLSKSNFLMSQIPLQ